MKVHLYSYLYRPDHAGGASVFTDLAESLASKGHDIRVICAYPFYPEWTNKSGANLFRRSKERLNDVDVERCGLYIPRNPTSLRQRAAYEATFFVSQLRTILSGPKPDVVMALAPLVSSVANAVLAAQIRRVPLWIHVQDISSGGAASFQDSGKAARLLGRLETALFKRANTLTTISPTMAEQLQTMTGRSDVMVLPNWLHSDLENVISDQLERPSHRESQDRPRLLYAGNIGVKQGLDELVRRLAETDLEFDLTMFGTGSGSTSLDQVLAEIDDPRFSRGPFLAEKQFAEELLRADIFLVSELDTGEAAFLPSKLVPAAACGCPVLAICGSNSPIRTEFAEHHTGRFLGWDEFHNIGDAISDMLTVDAKAAFSRATAIRAKTLSSSESIVRFERMLQEASSDSSQLRQATASEPKRFARWAKDSAAKLGKLVIASKTEWGRDALRLGVAATGTHQSLLKSLQPGTVIDVGANRGQFAMDVRISCPDANIISFEPYEPAVDVFKKVFAGHSNVRIEPVALGHLPGLATLNVSAKDDSSSLLPIGNLQKAVFPGTDLVKTQDTRITRMDDVILPAEIAEPLLIKIDVQGTELDVLRGGVETLRSAQWVYVECSFLELYEGQALAPDVSEFLSDNGFSLSRVCNPYSHQGSVIQADLLFARSDPKVGND